MLPPAEPVSSAHLARPEQHNSGLLAEPTPNLPRSSAPDLGLDIRQKGGARVRLVDVRAKRLA